MKVVPSDIYPAVRKFLEASELNRTLKALDKEMPEETPMKPKKAKALAGLELVAACQALLELKKLVHTDLHAAVRQFLLESGLNRSLKIWDKETSELEIPPMKPNKAAALEGLELVAACQAWLDSDLSGDTNGTAAVAEANGEAEPASRPEKKRKREEAVAVEETAVEEAAEEAKEEEEPVTKKSKKEKKEEKGEGKSGVPFQRIDNEKWIKTIKDSRFLNNTHTAKKEFGGSEGDSWADRASEDLLKVKGKGFRKEMQKKKRASWRGGGTLDQGINSIKFSDSEEE